MVEFSSVPVHVAIIMDGNGRWAKNKGLKRIEGHRVGVKVVKEIVEASLKIGIKFLTLFTFSTENWKRGEEEVNFLFELFANSVKEYIPELKANSIRLNVIGNLDQLPFFLRKAIDYAIKETEKGDKLTLTLAINYGSRLEIVEAVKKAKSTDMEITEESFKNFLFTKDLPDPDLIIRTSGEMRLSNFLLYQAAYSELFFTKTLWPDFTKEEFFEIITEFSKRERRFGGV